MNVYDANCFCSDFLSLLNENEEAMRQLVESLPQVVAECDPASGVDAAEVGDMWDAGAWLHSATIACGALEDGA